jgi:NADH-quinone oxidoreductase subunit G
VKNDKIYRVTNNAEFDTICGAGRYGFDFANKDVSKDKEAFNKAVEAFRDAKNITFSANITNEEALILQKLKEKTGAKLVCAEAKGYQEFLNAYSSVSGNALYSATLKDISNSMGIITLGTMVDKDAPVVRYHINMASKHNRARVIYMHPVEDIDMKNITTQFIKYEVGSEEGAMALLVDTLISDRELPQDIRSFVDDLDIGNLSAESNIGEEELEALKKSLLKKSGFTIIVGADLYNHPRAKNIAKLLALLEKFGGFKVMIIPPVSNALGVSLICELDDMVEGSTVGYNAKGDFTLASSGERDLDMPALNQQEGTITNIDKRVVSLNVAQPYGGYVLNDVANELGFNATYTIDYTKELPTAKGFKEIEFDNLSNNSDIFGQDVRGYLLSDISKDVSIDLEEIAELDSFDGAIIYQVNPQEQFNSNTYNSPLLDSDVCLLGSKAFATASKLSDGDTLSFKVGTIICERKFKIDDNLKGTIALNPTFDMGLSLSNIENYRFEKLSIIRNA